VAKLALVKTIASAALPIATALNAGATTFLIFFTVFIVILLFLSTVALLLY
jgi:hypothetical protein